MIHKPNKKKVLNFSNFWFGESYLTVRKKKEVNLSSRLQAESAESM